MSIKEIVTKVCNCDLCEVSVSNEKELTTLSIPIKFLTEQTEGRPVKPYYTNKKLDLCMNCRSKVVVVEGQGAQGYNDFWLK